MNDEVGYTKIFDYSANFALTPFRETTGVSVHTFQGKNYTDSFFTIANNSCKEKTYFLSEHDVINVTGKHAGCR